MMEQKLLVSPGKPLAATEKKQITGNLITGGEGAFEGYASLFDMPDLGNDVVMRGAFAQSLRLRGLRGIKMLWQHDAAEPIGSWDVLEEDRKGLYVKGRLNLAVARAREVHALMRDGAVDGLSIGFRAEKAVRDRKSGLRRLEKLDLWEVSVVTFPMLPQARVSAVKRGIPSECGNHNMADMPALAVRRALDAAAHLLR